jgi:hypothetical protein
MALKPLGAVSDDRDFRSAAVVGFDASNRESQFIAICAASPVGPDELGGCVSGFKRAAATTGSRLRGVFAAVIFGHLQAFGLREEIRLASEWARIAKR